MTSFTSPDSSERVRKANNKHKSSKAKKKNPERELEGRTPLEKAFNVLGLVPGNINPYDVLGLQTDATPAEIRTAYLKNAKGFCPDRHTKAAEPIMKAAIQLVNNARDTLAKPGRLSQESLSQESLSQESSGSRDYYDNYRNSQARQSSQESW